LVNRINNFEARNRQHCNFIRIIFVHSVNKKSKIKCENMRSFLQ
jgi:hypothetical protein